MPKTKELTAVQVLKNDHEKVKGLFVQFEKAKSEEEKDRIADHVDLELRVHSLMEEEILYPAFKDLDSSIVAESFEEHGVVEELLDELATLDLQAEQFSAKFKVMQENVEHHIEEEETKMFPRCAELPNYEKLGQQLATRKEELMAELSAGDASERASDGGLPGTIKASEKSEMVLEGVAMATGAAAPKSQKTPSTSGRAQRAAATSSKRK